MSDPSRARSVLVTLFFFASSLMAASCSSAYNVPMRAEPPMDLSIELTMTDAYAGADTRIGIEYTLPTLVPDVRIENITVIIGNGTFVEDIYRYNRTNDSPSPIMSSLDYDMNQTLSPGIYVIELGVMFFNSSEGVFYWNYSDASIELLDPYPLVGSIGSDTADADNSGSDHAHLSWVIERSTANLSSMEFNIGMSGSTNMVWGSDKDMTYLVSDPDNFTVVETKNLLTFDYNWTVPYDQSVGEYYLYVYAEDVFGFSGSVNASVLEVEWSQRQPIMTNDTIHVVEDDSVLVDIRDHFSDPNGEDLSFGMNTSGLENITVVQVSEWIINVSGAADWFGTAALEIEVSDNVTAPVPFTMNVVVHNMNDAPRPLNDVISGPMDSQIIIDLNEAFPDPDGDTELVFRLLGYGPHVNITLSDEMITITPDGGWEGTSNVTIFASDGVMNATYELIIMIEWPIHYLTVGIEFQDAITHIPGLPMGEMAAILHFSGTSGTYNISLNASQEAVIVVLREGLYNFSITFTIPAEFLYDENEGRSGYHFEARIIDVDGNMDMPLEMKWRIFVDRASWDDIDFDGSFMNRTDGEWTITVPVKGNGTGFDSIHLKLAVINDPDRNETLYFDFVWNGSNRMYVLELMKSDLQDFKSGELSYFFTDGSHHTGTEKNVFITKDSREDSIIVIAILVILIILVMAALVFIMRKPADEEDQEQDALPDDRACDSCGERMSSEERSCPNCGSIAEE